MADSWLANAGDGAISIATQRRIRAMSPDAAVLHAAYQSDLVGGHYPDLRFVPPLAALVRAVRQSRVPECRGWTEEELARIVDDADVVLSQGGGFLIEHYRPLQRLVAYERVLDRGLPLAFTAQTIGRFHGEDGRAALARALHSAVGISVRDRTSAENVVELGIEPQRVRLAVDEAFGLFPAPPSPREGQGVAVVLSRDTLEGASRSISDVPGLSRAATDIVRLTAEVAAPEPVTVLSTVQGLGSLDRGLEDDASFADEVLAELPRKVLQRVRRIDGYIAPLRFAELIARHRALVSMRMHPLIFALSTGIPAVAVTRADKTLELLSDLDMSEIAAPWLDPEGTADALRRALDPAGTRGPELWETLGTARRRAEVSSGVIGELISAAEARA